MVGRSSAGTAPTVSLCRCTLREDTNRLQQGNHWPGDVLEVVLVWTKRIDFSLGDTAAVLRVIASTQTAEQSRHPRGTIRSAP